MCKQSTNSQCSRGVVYHLIAITTILFSCCKATSTYRCSSLLGSYEATTSIYRCSSLLGSYKATFTYRCSSSLGSSYLPLPAYSGPRESHQPVLAGPTC